jgi:hypothetical protein
VVLGKGFDSFGEVVGMESSMKADGEVLLMGLAGRGSSAAVACA